MTLSPSLSKPKIALKYANISKRPPSARAIRKAERKQGISRRTQPRAGRGIGSVRDQVRQSQEMLIHATKGE